MRTSSMLGRILLSGASLAGVLALSGQAHAEERTHDGFYMSFNAGLGYLSTSGEPLPGFEESVSGVSSPFAFWLGGTVGPVAIGGGFFTDYVFSPSYEANGIEAPDGADLSLMLFSLGVFADIYPDPHSGLHIMPYLGWGGVELSVNGNSGGSDPTGLVTAVGVGYDFWVASEWSLGVMGRFAYAPLSMNDTAYGTIAPAILFTATYH